jgi:hypothetical protein
MKEFGSEFDVDAYEEVIFSHKPVRIWAQSTPAQKSPGK